MNRNKKAVSEVVTGIILAAAVLAVGIILTSYTQYQVNNMISQANEKEHESQKVLVHIYNYLNSTDCVLYFYFSGEGGLSLIYLNKTLIFNPLEPLDVNGDLVEVQVYLDRSYCNNPSQYLGEPITIVLANGNTISTQVLRVD